MLCCSYLDGGACGGGGALGSQHMDRWEVLWTKSTYVIPAARTMRPGQLVGGATARSCAPYSHPPVSVILPQSTAFPMCIRVRIRT